MRWLSLKIILTLNLGALTSMTMAAVVNLPNRAVTPGSLNPVVTQQNVGQTICMAGWTAIIRPPSAYTTALKQVQLRSGPYQSDLPTSAFEEDHLISLQLGGHPTDIMNLWPQPWAEPYGARSKDVVETWLKREVCEGRMLLVDAQRAISLNWIVVYQDYMKQQRRTYTPRKHPLQVVFFKRYSRQLRGFLWGTIKLEPS